MKRRTLFFLGLTGLAGCRRGGARRLNVFNWSDYVAQDTIPNFEREFDVQVRYAIYESNEEMLAKVIGGNSGWDVVFPSNYFIPPMLGNELLAELDHSLLPNLDALDSHVRSPEWDAGLRYSVPYMWGATGIVYDKQVAPAPESWADLWEGRFKGRLTMLDDPAEVIGAALKKLGLGLNSTSSRDLDRARAEMMAQKPLLRAYLNAEARDQMVSRDLLAAQLWATTSSQAMAEMDHLAFAYPREGFPIYSDNAVILRESGEVETAHELLNYLLRPEVAARIVEESLTATMNREARRRLPPALRDNEVLFPPEDVLARGEWFAALDPAGQRLRDRIWTEVKSA